MLKQDDFETRANRSTGIFWQGFVYESVPAFGDTRLAVIEDGGDYLIVQCYKLGGGAWGKLKDRLCGEPVRINRLGVGRPTNERINRLKAEIQCRASMEKLN